MKGRVGARGWFALGAAAGAVIVAAAVVLWSFAPVPCTAIGYVDLSPIRLQLPAGTSETAEVVACFDLNCEPTSLEPDSSGLFAVPQEPPYLADGLDVSLTGIYVEVRDHGSVVASNRFGILAVSDAPWWSRCPGPFHYRPVIVGG